jgi:hypothetical protein
MIYTVADLHGNQAGEMKYMNSSKWPEQKTLTKEDVLIQLGDFGYIWYNKNHKNYSEDKHWLEWFAARNYTLLIVPGNHDNYDIIDALPIIEKWGGKVHELQTSKGSIYVAVTGEVYTIDNKKILCIPHASSTDKQNRTNGESWWERETINNTEIENTLNNLEKPENETIDYIMSHTMPSSMIGQFIHMTIDNSGRFSDPTADFLEHIWNNHDIRYGVFCGHFHTNQREFRKTPHVNEHGRTVWTPDIDNNFVQCQYKRVPTLLED